VSPRKHQFFQQFELSNFCRYGTSKDVHTERKKRVSKLCFVVQTGRRGRFLPQVKFLKPRHVEYFRRDGSTKSTTAKVQIA
jgi:hypothetical protein